MTLYWSKLKSPQFVLLKMDSSSFGSVLVSTSPLNFSVTSSGVIIYLLSF